MNSEDLANFLMDELRELRHHIMKQVKLEGMTLQQFHFMKLLYHHEGETMSFYSEHLYLSRPNFSKLVTGLMERKWVEQRQDSGDRRISRLFLLPLGKNVLLENLGRLRRQSFASLGRLDEEERNSLEYHLKETFKILKKIK